MSGVGAGLRAWLRRCYMPPHHVHTSCISSTSSLWRSLTYLPSTVSFLGFRGCLWGRSPVICLGRTKTLSGAIVHLADLLPIFKDLGWATKQNVLGGPRPSDTNVWFFTDWYERPENLGDYLQGVCVCVYERMLTSIHLDARVLLRCCFSRPDHIAFCGSVSNWSLEITDLAGHKRAEIFLFLPVQCRPPSSDFNVLCRFNTGSCALWTKPSLWACEQGIPTN